MKKIHETFSVKCSCGANRTAYRATAVNTEIEVVWVCDRCDRA